jgi:predicted permease
MGWLRFFRRNRKRLELQEEIESYIDLSADENIARGMAPSEARVAARRKFGNTTLVQETVHEMNTFTVLDSLWSDIRYGARVLRLNPGFFLVATFSLALGTGANTAIFQLINAVRLRMLPVPHAEQLAQIRIADNEHCCNGNFSARHSEFTNAQWEQIRDHQQAFSGIFAFGDTRFNVAERGEARYVEGIWVSGSFFRALGVNPVVGRLIGDQDDHVGCAPVAVASHAYWQRELGADPQAVGRKISLAGHPVEIVGVASPGFFGVEVGRSFDVAVPICSDPIINGEESHLAKRHHWWLAIMGRLKPGWTIERAKAQAEAISREVFESTLPPNYTPDVAKWYVQYKLTARPAGSGVSELRSDYEDPLWLLLGIAGAVLLIACANLANLMLARASVRAREMAVRLAIGAGQGRLVRQMLTECALLTVAGAALGAVLANVLSVYLVRFLSNGTTPLFLDLGVDWRILAFTFGTAITTCLLFGLTPAIRAAAIAPGEAMKAGGRSVTANRSGFGLRRALVVTQVALSLVLLSGAMLFSRSLRNLTKLDVGLVEDGVLIMDTDLTNLHYSPERRGQMYQQLLTRLRGTPGIEHAATASVLQLSGNGWNDSIEITGVPASEKRMVPWFARVSSGYFGTMGIPIVAGRDFNERDTPGSPEVAVVTQQFGEKFLNGADPMGREFRIIAGPGEEQHLFQIVGVVRNSRYRGIRYGMDPLVYVASTQDKTPPVGVHVLLGSRGPTGTLTALARRAALGANGDLLLQFLPYRTLVDRTMLRDQLMAGLSGFFGFLAAILATVGLYGVISYMVARRRNEIGIRVALGADRASIVRLVIREALVLLAAGLVIGTALTASGSRLTKSLLYGLEGHDPSSIGFAVALLAAVSLCASLWPALRASRLDPTQALREE